jgi:hypothetical protein
MPSNPVLASPFHQIPEALAVFAAPKLVTGYGPLSKPNGLTFPALKREGHAAQRAGFRRFLHLEMSRHDTFGTVFSTVAAFKPLTQRPFELEQAIFALPNADAV